MSAPHIPATAAATFTLPGIEFTGLAAPSRGARESCVWMVKLAPGTPGAAHQLTREEVLVVLEGAARATLNGSDYELSPGSAFIIPPRTDFTLANPYDADFRAVAVLPVGGAAVVDGETFVPMWAV